MTPTFIPTGKPRLPRNRQRGGFLLEALVGILIFTLGVIALLTLQARAISYTSDANYRGEAAYLANDLISRMWAENRTNLTGLYTATGQTGYDAFRTAVIDRLPGADVAGNPSVEIIQPAAGAVLTDARGDGSGITLTSTGTLVTITILWTPPAQEGVAAPIEHRFQISTILAHNS